MIPVLIILLILAVALLVGVIGMYNGLVKSRQLCMNAWSQIDVQLKRRYDLIPNLVETAKGFMAHEKDTLERVIQARNQAVSAHSVGEKSQAESQLTSVLGGFMAIAESYPELKSDKTMVALQEELAATENKISFARQYYNDTVTQFNIQIETFPSSIIAGLGNFKPRDLFELTDSIQREPVQVKF